jgi:hypothetical protein
VITKFGLKGRFEVEHWRNGVLLNSYFGDNAVTDEGKTNFFLTMFVNSPTPDIDEWFIGLIEDGGTLAATDAYTELNADFFEEMNGNNGWVEATNYEVGAVAARPVWPLDDLTDNVLSNVARIQFDFTGSATIAGAFLCAGVDANVLGDNAEGVIWATALFSSPVPVESGDGIKLRYSISA